MGERKTFKDLTGQRFGRLVVLERAANRKSHARFKVKCDCGAEKTVLSQCLIQGDTTSCGCFAREKGRPQPANRRGTPVEVAARSLFNRMKTNAADRGLVWAISQERFLELTSGDCDYCGIEPSQFHRPYSNTKGGTKTTIVTERALQAVYRYNGIDRVDNAVGYVEGNVVPCCWSCNCAKADSTREEYVARCVRVGKRWGGLS